MPRKKGSRNRKIPKNRKTPATKENRISPSQESIDDVNKGLVDISLKPGIIDGPSNITEGSILGERKYHQEAGSPPKSREDMKNIIMIMAPWAPEKRSSDNAKASPNVAPIFIESTLLAEAAPDNSNNNNEIQQNNFDCIFSAHEKARQPAKLAFLAQSIIRATSETCNDPMAGATNTPENEQVNIVTASLECNQGLVTQTFDKEKDFTPDCIENTPPAIDLSAEVVPVTSNCSNVVQKNVASIFSRGEVRHIPTLASLALNAAHAALHTCDNPKPELEKPMEIKRTNFISDLREFSESLIMPNSDKEKELNQSAASDITSPNITPGFIEGTPPLLPTEQKNAVRISPTLEKDMQTPTFASRILLQARKLAVLAEFCNVDDSMQLNNIESGQASIVTESHKCRAVSPKRIFPSEMQTGNDEELVSPSVLMSNILDQGVEPSTSGTGTHHFVSLEEDLCLSDDSVADPNWEDAEVKRRKSKLRIRIEETESNTETETEETEPPKKKKRINKTARWHKKNQDTYNKNRQKVLRAQCLPYINTKNQPRPAKTPRANACICRLNCAAKFTNEQRSAICKSFWGLADYKRQKDYILMNVQARAPKVRLVDAKKPRSVSRYYYLKSGQSKIRVCEKFFKGTLCISNGPINTAFTEIGVLGNFQGEDTRGKHEPANKTSKDDEEYVKKHIESFPTMESHYCRKTSSKLYLESNLSIPKMYELYEEKCKTDGKAPVSDNVYRRIFCTQYNYEFHRTKKDQCGTCNKYHTAKAENSEDLAVWEEKYKQHIYLKEQSQAAKDLDKTRANTDETFVSATMDLQKVLHMPHSNVSLLYYLRKINVYNATIYEASSPNEGYCFLWNELNGKKGSDEIGTALYLWIKRLPPKVKEISLFTDTCGGQNRNQFILCLLLYLVQTTDLKVIEHKYLESGHSHMEVDSMHSAIEHQLTAVSVFSMNDYCNIVKLARSDRKKKKGTKKNPYQTVVMNHSDILDLKDLKNNLMKNRTSTGKAGEKMQWLKVKCFRFEKERPGVVLYRYDYESEYKELDVIGKEIQPKRKSARPCKGKKSEPFDFKTYKMKSAYSSLLPITSLKKKDLLKMITEKIIPTELHNWYENLPDKDGKDYLPGEDTEVPEELQD